MKLQVFLDNEGYSIIIINVNQSWVDISQTIGIIVGFAITIYELRKTSKLTRFDIFWRIGDSHREVWKPILENKDLDRILSNHPSIDSKPITNKERVFTISVILHIENVYKAYREGFYKVGDNELKDIGELFSAPIFSSIWNEIKDYQRIDFVKFIEGLKTNPLLKEARQ